MIELGITLRRNEAPQPFTGHGSVGSRNYGNTELLGKRVVNKTVGLFGSRQVAIGDQPDNKRAQTDRFRSALENVHVPPLTDVERAGLNVKLPKIYEALLRTDDSSYIQSIGAEDVNSLPDIGLQLALSDTSPSVAFRLVFGATEQMPLRAVSYLLPALQTMERIVEAGGSAPQLQVVFAHQVSSKLNRLDNERVNNQSLQFAQVARVYMQDFFPALDGSAVFLEDTSVGRGTLLRAELLSLTDKFSHVSTESRNDLAGKGNGSGRFNKYYAAAHLLMHDRDGDGYLQPLTPDQPDFVIPTSIVSFGGGQERLFYKIRHEMKPHVGPEYSSVGTLQYFTRHHVPPYYMARGGDISLDDATKGTDTELPISEAAAYDLTYLRRISGARGDFDSFLRGQKVKIAV